MVLLLGSLLLVSTSSSRRPPQRNSMGQLPPHRNLDTGRLPDGNVFEESLDPERRLLPPHHILGTGRLPERASSLQMVTCSRVTRCGASARTLEFLAGGNAVEHRGVKPFAAPRRDRELNRSRLPPSRHGAPARTREFLVGGNVFVEVSCSHSAGRRPERESSLSAVTCCGRLLQPQISLSLEAFAPARSGSHFRRWVRRPDLALALRFGCDARLRASSVLPLRAFLL